VAELRDYQRETLLSGDLHSVLERCGGSRQPPILSGRSVAIDCRRRAWSAESGDDEPSND
jgi:hypothetical protein